MLSRAALHQRATKPTGKHFLGPHAYHGARADRPRVTYSFKLLSSLTPSAVISTSSSNEVALMLLL